MKLVSLIGTVHDDLGLANASELHVILQRLSPEIIFLEVPTEAFSDYYGETHTRSNLESRAVRRYRTACLVQLVPVDLPTPPREFFEDFDHLRARLRAESLEYRQLMDWDKSRTMSYGFAYLNSEHCAALWKNVHSEILMVLKGVGDSRLVTIYDSWRKTLELRDHHMTDKIRAHCRDNDFDRSVLLVGAAHRQPIIDIARELSGDPAADMIWD